MRMLAGALFFGLIAVSLVATAKQQPYTSPVPCPERQGFVCIGGHLIRP